MNVDKLKGYLERVVRDEEEDSISFQPSAARALLDDLQVKSSVAHSEGFKLGVDKMRTQQNLSSLYGNVNQQAVVLTAEQRLDQKIEGVRKEMRDSLDRLRGVLCIDGKNTALALASRLCVLEKGQKRHDEHAKWHELTGFGERIEALEKQNSLCDDHCVAVDMRHNDIGKRLLALENAKAPPDEVRLRALESRAEGAAGYLNVHGVRLGNLENWRERISKA